MKTPSTSQTRLLSVAFSAVVSSATFAATLSDTSPFTTIATGTHDGNTAAATKETGEPNHGFHVGGASVWGTFTASEDGVYIFDTIGSNYDTTLGVYLPGGEFTEYKRVGANNNITGGTGANTASESMVYLTAFEPMAVAVDGTGDSTVDPATNVTGTVVLNIRKATTTDPNDNFANALDLGNGVTESESDTNLNASRQIDEPIHGGDDTNLASTTWGGASLWYKWTAPQTTEFVIDTAGSTQTLTGASAEMDTLLAVYTSAVLNPTTFGELTLLVENNDPAAGLAARVTVAATTGTVYYIAVDGRNSVSTFQHRGTIQLSIGLSPVQSVFPFASSWEYLQNAVEPKDDPAVDTHPAFHTSWHSHAEGFSVSGAPAYDGPAFLGPAPGLFVGPSDGSGVIDFAAANTTLPQSTKDTTYFRKKFTLPAAGAVGAEIVADDGAIIYIDGVEKNRVNMGTLVDGWNVYAPATGVETATSLSLGLISAGDHVIAVSVHNVTDNASGSDIGFDLRLFTDSRAPIITGSLNAAGGINAPFTYQISIDPNIPATSYSATGLPAGLTIDTNTGLITGTPTSQGTTNVQISATNPNGTDTETLVINIGSAFGDVALVPGTPAGTGFEEPARLSTSYVRGTNGTVEIGWSTTLDTANAGTADVRDPATAGDHGAVGTGPGSAAPHTAPPNKFFRIVDRFVQPFSTDKINISGLSASEKAVITVKIDVRTFTNSATSFEDPDTLRIFVESSTDGITFAEAGNLVNAVGDGPLMTYRHDDGTYTTLSSAGVVTIPGDSNSIRLVIQGGPDSTSEFIYLDNIVFEVGGGEPTDFRITNVTKVGSNVGIEWTSEAGATYQVEKSIDLITWIDVGPQVPSQGTVTGTSVNATGEGPQVFYRVKKL